MMPSPFAPWPLALILGGLLFHVASPDALQSQDVSHSQVAHEYFRALAEGGVADAQLAMGDLYREGKGVSTNLLEAYAWYYLAAHQGVEEAVQPMNDVLRALPESRWPQAKQLAEDYAQRYLPAGQRPTPAEATSPSDQN